MMFQVEVTDFWLDEDQDLAPALKRAIVNKAVKTISEQMAEKIDKLISEAISEAVEKAIEPVIEAELVKFMEEGTVKERNRGDTRIPFALYFRNLFEANQGWNAGTQIERYAKNFGENMKLQYNAAFANQIVQNLKEQGMLKDEVVNALLAPPVKK